MQECKYCARVLPESDFGIAKTVPGKVYRRRKCRFCYRATKNVLKLKRRGWIDVYKEREGCAECGINDPRVLEFHHIDESAKLFAIADYYYHNYSFIKLEEEIKKCKVLCANCHRILHFNQRN